MTPPELARMSGTRKTPFLSRTLSASGVVGPLAHSTIIFALTPLAMSFVIAFSRAAGHRMSHLL